MIGITSFAIGLLALASGIGGVVSDDTVNVLRGGMCDDDVKVVQAPAGGVFFLCSAGDGGGVKVVVDKKMVEEAPSAWIGVRVAPVPEPLAAHIGRDGLMIANVVVDSPADHAGVERYDVVVSFNGRPIEELSDLHEAISENGAGEAASVVVIHAGQERTLEITPIERDAQGAAEFKYDEPEAVIDEPRTFFWGNRMRPGPDGKWLFEPFGRMDKLPDRVKEFLDRQDMPDFDWKEWADQWPDWADEWPDLSNRRWRLRDLPFGVEIEIGDDASPYMKWFGSGDEDDVKAEIRIEISEDGKTIEIHRAKDGKIDVERVDPEGEKSSATYEGLEQLREQDEEAYDVLLGHLGPHGFAYSWRVPDVKTLHEKQRDFQKKVKRYVDQHTGRARDVYGRPLPGSGQGSGDLFTWKQRRERDDGSSRISTMKITIEDDGHITVETVENGESKTYEFDGRADFKAREPELYERLHEHLD